MDGWDYFRQLVVVALSYLFPVAVLVVIVVVFYRKAIKR